MSVYVDHPDFQSLYLRKIDRLVSIDGISYICFNVITLANITVKKPGKGIFTKLVQELIERGFAVAVECVGANRFCKKLERMGFVQSNFVEGGKDFVINYENHLRI